MLPLPDPEPQHLSPCLCRALDMDTVLPRCLYIPRALKVASDFLLGLEVFEGHHLISSGTSGKESPINARDTRDAASIPESGRSPGGGNGSQLQYPCLENSMDRGAWQATAHGVSKSQLRLSAHTHTSNNTASNIQVMTPDQEPQGISGNLKPFSPSFGNSQITTDHSQGELALPP